ncbi:DcrB-related protein [Brenneria tiliae]|uniref:DcrB-related protein n=1 Tax=Brenneria tiliae TaxID=2914984 RepID=UPI0029624841|nr:DcrB-related protein [Brenneria tiliae]
MSRDTLQPTETLSAYIDRQVQLLAQHLKGWRSDERQPVALGQTVQGECVPASYLRDGKRIWQQQAVFALTDGSVLVFTQSKNDRLSDADKALFQALLGSFSPADHQ